MAQELGRVERPSAGQYRGKRKLLLVPLMYSPPNVAEDGLAILEKYWEQVRIQIAALERSLGQLRHLYCESLAVGGSDGLKHLEMADQYSYSFVKAKCEAGAALEPTEDREALAEILDLQRFLVLPLASEKVARRVHDWFSESNKARYEHIAEQINSTLGEDETGLLLISERHQVQFPSDIEVFYVAPPALDEFRRWFQNWASPPPQPADHEDSESHESESGGPTPRPGE